MNTFKYLVGLFGRGMGPSQGNTTKKDDDIHASSGIRTHKPSFRQAEDIYATDRAANGPGQ